MTSPGIRLVMGELDREVSSITAAIAITVVRFLTAPPSQGGTPRLTGFAAANWIPYIGDAPDRPLGSKQAPPFALQRANIQNVAIGYRISQGTITVSNPVAYIGRLNAGSSRQASPGFVQAAIRRAFDRFQAGQIR